MEKGLGSKETVCFKFENNDLKVIFSYLRHLYYCKIDLTSLAMNSICEKSTWKSTLNFVSSFDLNFIKMSTKFIKIVFYYMLRADQKIPRNLKAGRQVQNLGSNSYH